MQSPERPVPQDQRIALTDRRRLHLADEDLVVAGGVVLHQPAFEPRCAGVDERDAVGARPAKRSAMNSWDRVSKLMLNALVSKTATRVADSSSRPTSTMGGSSEMETRLLAVRPRNSSPTRALTTTTPEGRRAMASRNCSLDTCRAQPSGQVV